MQDVLSAALKEEASDADDRVLAAAFFRKRPLQAGSSPMVANIVRLADHRRKQTQQPTDSSFLDRWRTTLK